MKNYFPHLAAVLAGLACVGLLLWMWGRDLDQARLARETELAAAAARATPSRATQDIVEPTAPPDPATSALLAKVRQALLRRDVRRNEALLTFRDEASYRRFLDRAAKAGLTILGQLDGSRTVRVRFDDFGALRHDLLQNTADYDGFSPNFLVGIPVPPPQQTRAAINEVPYGNQALTFLGAGSLDRTQWGRGVTIAILDTGVQPDATFGEVRLRTLDIGLGTTVGQGADDGHGTAVAALAAGQMRDAPGVAPAATILSVRVTDDSGTSDVFTIAQGIIAATDAGARVINISMGGYGTSTALENAIAYATGHGIAIVAAAGNDQAAQLTWPAADPRVVSVGAVDAMEQQVTFSNSGDQLKLTAPGYGVQTAWLDGQRAYVDGTSASAPFVAGAIAAVISQNPAITPQAAAQLLERTSDDVGAPGADPAYGAGVLNLGWAMNSGSPGYVDTAISSHYYDAANQQMDFVVQNRSSQPVSNLTLNINAAGQQSTQTIPSLMVGEIYIAKVPVDPAALQAGPLTYSTRLINPPGVVDHVPVNNSKSTTLGVAPTVTH